MSSLFLTTILLPFAYFFYETNEDNDYKTRFCTAFGNEIILLVIFSCIHFPMFSSWRHSFIPVDSEAYRGLEGTPSTELLNKVFLLPDNESENNFDDTTYFAKNPKLLLDT